MSFSSVHDDTVNVDADSDREHMELSGEAVPPTSAQSVPMDLSSQEEAAGASCTNETVPSFSQADPHPAFEQGACSAEERVESLLPSCESTQSNTAEEVGSDAGEGACPASSTDNQEGETSALAAAGSRSADSQTMDLTSVFQLLEDSAVSLLKDGLKKSERYLSPDYPACSESDLEDNCVLEGDDQTEESSAREGVRMITMHILRTMNQKDLADRLERNELQIACQRKLRHNLKKQLEYLYDGSTKHGSQAVFNKVYTEMYITEGGAAGVSDGEVLREDTGSKETTMKCSDIFRPLTWHVSHIRTVVTKGVSGIGKTVSVQKFILDWAERKTNQDIHLVFDLPFRDLNLLNTKQWSLVDLLQHCLPEIKMFGSIDFSNYKILFIFDGLDECHLPLNFQNNINWFDMSLPTSLDVLLTNLIKGNLLPSSLIWITSRPAVANHIPPEYVHRVTEIRGFTDPQKEEYFMKRLSDTDMSRGILTHLRSSKSLYVTGHLPVFCWISATVLAKLLHMGDVGELPKSLTEMYTHFLVCQTAVRNQPFQLRSRMPPKLMESDKELVVKMGKLAFHHLRKGNVIFTEEDVREFGIDVHDISVYPGICAEIFKEELDLHQGKMYCFVHLSIQEYLAALYVFLSNGDKTSVVGELTSPYADHTMSQLLNAAVDETLQSKDGHLDLFLRFLLGLAMDSSQAVQQGLLQQTGNSSTDIKETVEYIKKKIRENLSPERTISLLHCLIEMNDSSLVGEVQTFLRSGGYSAQHLTPEQWSALVIVLLMSEEELDVFELKKYIISDEGLLRLLPVVIASRIALLSGCSLTEASCKGLASVISSNKSRLTELDLGYNDLQDFGVKLLSSGLENPHCKLEKLRLTGCRVTEKGCTALASALRSNPSHLRELHLSNNHPGDLGVRVLSAVLEDPNCRLERLWLSGCGFAEGGCVSLASALRLNPSHLRELDLSCNPIGCSGVRLLSALLHNPKCHLEILRLSLCGVTEVGCTILTAALHSNPSHLRELDLSNNRPGDSGVRLLSALLEDPKCKLEKLKIFPRLDNPARS